MISFLPPDVPPHVAYAVAAMVIVIVIASSTLIALGHDGALVGILVAAAAWAFGAGSMLRRPPT
jgi:hypothetical protein